MRFEREGKYISNNPEIIKLHKNKKTMMLI